MLLQRRGGLFCCGVWRQRGGRAPFSKDDSPDDVQSPHAKSAAGTGAGVAATAMQLSWALVEAMTGGFTSAIFGDGAFSSVYLARLAGSLATVKVHRSSECLHRAFRQELDMLLRVRHPHIVRLLAFCDQRDEGLLVLQFAPNGKHLHGGGDGTATALMPWARQVSVVLQVARALEYPRQVVVYMDETSQTVLLDSGC